MAGRNELHHPPSVGRGVRLRPSPRLRIRQRPDYHRTARQRNAARAARLQRRRRDRPGEFFVLIVLGLERSFRVARVRWPRWSSAARVHRRHPRRVLDYPAHLDPCGWLAMKRHRAAFLVAPCVACVAVWAPRRTAAAKRRFPRRPSHPGLGPRSRSRDGCRRTLGRAARRARHLAAAGDLPRGHGFRWHVRTHGRSLPGVEIGIALSGIFLGLAVLSEWRPPLWAAASSSACLQFFMATRTAPNFLPAPAACFTARLRHGHRSAARGGHTAGLVHRWPAGRAVLRWAGRPSRWPGSCSSGRR